MTTRREWISTAVMAAVAVAAVVVFKPFGGPATAGEQVGYEQVAAGLDAGKMLLVDVREVNEFTEGHIPGSINLPLSRFQPNALPTPEGRQVVITCRSGRRAAQALAAVEATGRRDVAIYAGSMNDWVSRKGPVVTGP